MDGNLAGKRGKGAKLRGKELLGGRTSENEEELLAASH